MGEVSLSFPGVNNRQVFKLQVTCSAEICVQVSNPKDSRRDD